MKKELYYSTETGEILEGSAAIADFYETHGGLESWRDVWHFFEYGEEEEAQPVNFSDLFSSCVAV